MLLPTARRAFLDYTGRHKSVQTRLLTLPPGVRAEPGVHIHERVRELPPSAPWAWLQSPLGARFQSSAAEVCAYALCSVD